MKSFYSKPQDVNLSRDTCRRIQEVMTARKINFSDLVSKAIQEQLDKAEAIQLHGFGDYSAALDMKIISPDSFQVWRTY